MKRFWNKTTPEEKIILTFFSSGFTFSILLFLNTIIDIPNVILYISISPILISLAYLAWLKRDTKHKKTELYDIKKHTLELITNPRNWWRLTWTIILDTVKIIRLAGWSIYQIIIILIATFAGGAIAIGQQDPITVFVAHINEYMGIAIGAYMCIFIVDLFMTMFDDEDSDDDYLFGREECREELL